MSARDAGFADWVTQAMVRAASPSAVLGVELRFAGPGNLRDIATGRLKNVIDCLHPVLGGRAGAPNDARIVALEAARMDAEVNGTVRVRVVELMGERVGSH